MPFEHILVAVHPFSDDNDAAERVARLAKRCGARITLQTIVWQPHFARDLFHLSGDQESTRSRVEEAAHERLRGLAGRLDTGVVDCAVDWGHPFDERMLSAIETHRPDLVVMSTTRKHRPSTAEWRLIRGCRTPLMICKDQEWGSPPRVMACVDPSHAHDKPDDVDAKVVAGASALAECLGDGYQILHAAGMTPELDGDKPYTYQYREQQDREREAAIRGLLPAATADQTVINFSHSTPAEAIEAFVRERGLDICVLGLINRTRWQELLIGSTPRALISKVDCDLLLLPYLSAS